MVPKLQPQSEPFLFQQHQQQHQQHHTEDEGTFEINLPSDLAQVLALSPSHTSSYLRDKTEQKVVKELLYGSRERHYNPQRGGIVYDVGEEDQSEGVDGGEDDWEGEPVPWEVGEL